MTMNVRMKYKNSQHIISVIWVQKQNEQILNEELIF